MLKRVSVLVIALLAVVPVFAQVRVVKFNTLENLLKNSSDSTIVVNFWATWCKPCIAELPHFEELNKKYMGHKLKIVLVSLDFKKELDTRVKPFVAKNNITPEVLLLDEPDYNSWINRVDSTWSGAIPATVIISQGKHYFFEKDFSTFEELESTVKPLIR